MKIIQNLKKSKKTPYYRAFFIDFWVKMWYYKGVEKERKNMINWFPGHMSKILG